MPLHAGEKQCRAFQREQELLLHSLKALHLKGTDKSSKPRSAAFKRRPLQRFQFLPMPRYCGEQQLKTFFSVKLSLYCHLQLAQNARPDLVLISKQKLLHAPGYQTSQTRQQ